MGMLGRNSPTMNTKAMMPMMEMMAAMAQAPWSAWNYSKLERRSRRQSSSESRLLSAAVTTAFCQGAALNDYSVTW